jgi:uncharacterized protein
MQALELEKILRAVGGGAMIGVAASMWLLVLGQICGISGILAGVLPGDPNPDTVQRPLRAAFLVGLVGTGLAMKLVTPSVFGPDPGTRTRDLVVIAIAGLLVGVGTRIGGGCTSGHGVCGISRGSVRSIVATCVFMGVAILTVYARRALGWP